MLSVKTSYFWRVTTRRKMMFWREAREFQLPVCFYRFFYHQQQSLNGPIFTSNIMAHSSKERVLCWMNWPCKTLQNLPYFWAYQNLGSFLLFFKVVYFSLMNALDGLWLLAMQFISENIKYVKRSISLEHFFKHKPPNSEEWNTEQ